RKCKGSSDAPSQRLVEAVSELEVVAGVDDAVAVDIEKGLVGEHAVERAAESEVVAAVDDRLEIDSRRSADGSAGSIRVAIEAIKGCRPIGSHAKCGRAFGADLGRVN